MSLLDSRRSKFVSIGKLLEDTPLNRNRYMLLVDTVAGVFRISVSMCIVTAINQALVAWLKIWKDSRRLRHWGRHN